MSNQKTPSVSKNQKTKEYLDYYLNLESEPQFAVLLTGTWGGRKDLVYQKLFKEQTN